MSSAHFFFSSRRRHTRLTCDWSSDVCSSDLEVRLSPAHFSREFARAFGITPHQYLLTRRLERRSEERRVGKEGRSRGAAAHEKKQAGPAREGDSELSVKTMSAAHTTSWVVDW